MPRVINGKLFNNLITKPFIKKIYQIINDPSLTSIYWTSKGNSFVIDKDKFEVSMILSSLSNNANFRMIFYGWTKYKRSLFRPKSFRVLFVS